VPQSGSLRLDHELCVDWLELKAPIRTRALDEVTQLPGAHDNDVGASAVGRVRLNPGVSEGNISGLGDHVIAPVARRILKEAGAPVSVGEMPPILLGVGAVLQVKVSAIPIRRPPLVFYAIIDRPDFTQFAPHLPSEALNHGGALLVTTEQAKRVRHALADRRVSAAQQVDGLNEARNADDRIAPRRSADFAKDLRQLDRIVAGFGTAP